MIISLLKDYKQLQTKHFRLAKIFDYLVSLFILSIPLSVRAVIYSSTEGANGFFNPFTSSFFCFSDLIVIFIMVIFGISLYKGVFKLNYFDGRAQRMIWLYTLSLTILACFSAVFAKDITLVFHIAIRSVLYLFMIYIFCNKYYDLNKGLKFLIATMVFQSGLSIAQHYFQSSLE